MLIKKAADILPSEITDEALYINRRRFLAAGTAAAAALALPKSFADDAPASLAKLPIASRSPYSTSEKETSYQDITHYNNFYEFGTDKYSPAELAGSLLTRPWHVSVEGAVRRPRVYAIDELIKANPLEERIYRHRCVEGWSMVIPWVGFPLERIIRQVEPTGSAKFIQFVTLYNPSEMPGQRSDVLDWPYVEGLRLDEAMNPLTLLAVGLYGRALPNQDGAPIRLVVPWKYGFKSIKSIVKIRFVDKQPVTTWAKSVPTEYGFYSNVNPTVDHPRWSQATERRIGEFFKRPTLMFNGYGDQVAQLYRGMDLRKYF